MHHLICHSFQVTFAEYCPHASVTAHTIHQRLLELGIWTVMAVVSVVDHLESHGRLPPEPTLLSSFHTRSDPTTTDKVDKSQTPKRSCAVLTSRNYRN
ncbi:hypothetical protein PHET_02165 [Paragonimus heterotremus]|uniref:Uncharacterized protein n=1 Tax=Paragonimus heterotremus TaxID=100268 RepID=A0A8J4TLL9_9TREM|nr:hypothetical protein PHET_02165 [Paragonimus heterotremus]